MNPDTAALVCMYSDISKLKRSIRSDLRSCLNASMKLVAAALDVAEPNWRRKRQYAGIDKHTWDGRFE